MKDVNKAIDSQKAFHAGTDMSASEKQLLDDIVNKTEFVPNEVIWRSSYWGTNQIGAVHYRGMFKDNTAILKIQGAKPDVSEIEMIGHFRLQNRSKLIRPPKIFYTLPWNDSLGYEALIMEEITGEKVLESKKLQSAEKIHEFFGVYQEYRKNCIPHEPWLVRPELSDWRGVIDKLWLTSHKAYPNQIFRKSEDLELGYQAARAISKIFTVDKLEFVHGHFSVEDLMRQDDEIVLFSNLFWKWRPQGFDAVFGYHWFMYELAHVEGITQELVEQQRELWLDEIYKQNDRIILSAALLERAISGLIIDSFLVDSSNPIAEYLVESTRVQVKKLTVELQ